VAVLYFSYRLIQFPLGIASTSLAQAILPTLSTQALEETHQSLTRTLSFGLRATFLVMMPASVAFMVLSRPIIATLFAGGKFDAYSVEMTAQALFFYSIGLVAYAATKITQSCFFAMKDTVTPTKVSALALGLNILFCVVLMVPLKIAGLALATSLSGMISFFVLFFMLVKKLPSLDCQEIVKSFLRVCLASVCMGLVCVVVSQYAGGYNKYAHLGIALAAAGASYVFFCALFRVGEMRELIKMLKSRRLIPNS
jgi:putative peptidoglycan lipid II flippase